MYMYSLFIMLLAKYLRSDKVVYCPQNNKMHKIIFLRKKQRKQQHAQNHILAKKTQRNGLGEDVG